MAPLLLACSADGQEPGRSSTASPPPAGGNPARAGAGYLAHMPRVLALVVLASILACSGGPPASDVATPPPAPVEPAPTPAVEEPLGDEQAPVGGWIQDEVLYDADGNVYGCVGGGNWCASAPPLDPKTRKPRPR
jgi:hypothetical protein